MNKATFKLSKQAAILVITLSLVVTGCASKSPINQLSTEDELSIDLKQSNYAEKPVSISNEELGKTTAELGGGGAMAGAAAGLSCGVYALICSPLAMIVGGVVGGGVGLVVGAASQLDETTRDTISTKLTSAIRIQQLDDVIYTNIRNRSGNVFSVKETLAPNHLTLHVTNIRLNSYDEGVSLVIVLQAQLQFLDDNGQVVTKVDHFIYDSTPINTNSWVMADETFYQQLFSSAAYHLSEQIVSNLLKEDKPTPKVASL